MSKTLRVGLIGCGRQTRLNLAPAFARLPAAALIACADTDGGAARETAEEFEIEEIYTDAEEMIGDADADAVIVAVPHRDLRDVALKAIRAGKHAFIEKPMGLNASEGLEISEAARKHGVLATVGYCMRYSLSRIFMKSLLDRKVVGDVVFVSAGKGSAPSGGWLAAPYSAGGGQLLFLGSHVTDQVLWLTGKQAEAVSGTVRWNAQKTDETSAYTVRMSGGAVATFSVSRQTYASYDYVEILGTKGRIRGEWYGDQVSVQSQVISEYEHPTVVRIPGDNLREMCYREMEAFVQAVVSGGSPPIPLSDGIQTLKILDAVVSSNDTGGWVKI